MYENTREAKQLHVQFIREQQWKPLWQLEIVNLFSLSIPCSQIWLTLHVNHPHFGYNTKLTKKNTDDYQEGKASVKTKTDGNGSIDGSKQAEYTAAYVVDTLDHKA